MRHIEPGMPPLSSTRPFSHLMSLSDDIVISVGVLVGLAKLVIVFWRLVSMSRSVYAARKEQHMQLLRKAFTLADHPHDDSSELFKQRNNNDDNASYSSTLDKMPDALRVPSASFPEPPRHDERSDLLPCHPYGSSYQRRSSAMNESMSYFVALGEKFEMKGLRPFRIDDSLLHADELVAKGAYGEVWRGRYLGAVVAIKTLVSTHPQTIDHITVFVNEIQLMVELHHPCICRVLGASWLPSGDIQMVMEFLVRGDLTSHLAKTTPSSCSWDDKVLLALDIADGLTYVHHRHVIHRDLKSRNVLLCDRVTDEGRRVGAKLTDFGLSRTVKDYNTSLSCGVGTYRWMAPELFLGSRYTSAVDVYSFGMILSELDSHQVPFRNLRTDDGHILHEMGIMDKVRLGLLRPAFSASCPEWITTLGMQCVDMEPSRRPTAEQVKATLQTKLIDSSLFE
ncbi:hypothetical protein DYB38_013796 [Aphanomyces astaci]|uniref:Protein kinase domain-containing protein n=1 Tax=Aphanomyces astaci TaxID=112090 RepID=A0A397E7B8_APHAT|nr:hypothetical protein DYB38_013796 [Aphanomyces astaci]